MKRKLHFCVFSSDCTVSRWYWSVPVVGGVFCVQNLRFKNGIANIVSCSRPVFISLTSSILYFHSSCCSKKKDRSPITSVLHYLRNVFQALNETSYYTAQLFLYNLLVIRQLHSVVYSSQQSISRLFLSPNIYPFPDQAPSLPDGLQKVLLFLLLPSSLLMSTRNFPSPRFRTPLFLTD